MKSFPFPASAACIIGIHVLRDRGTSACLLDVSLSVRAGPAKSTDESRSRVFSVTLFISFAGLTCFMSARTIVGRSFLGRTRMRSASLMLARTFNGGVSLDSLVMLDYVAQVKHTVSCGPMWIGRESFCISTHPRRKANGRCRYHPSFWRSWRKHTTRQR